MENPFLTPPQVESDKSRSWGMGFAFGFQGPAQSSLAPSDIGPEDADAFDIGVLAGQDAAINGFALAQPCVDMNVEPPSLPHPLHIAASGLEGGMAIWDLAAGAFAGAVLGGVLLAVSLSIALETFSDDPNDALAKAATDLQGQLQRLGFSETLELFVGGGVDTTVAGCGLLLSPIHRDQQAATAAARGLGRSQWLVASWRTDQSAGVKIVAFS